MKYFILTVIFLTCTSYNVQAEIKEKKMALKACKKFVKKQVKSDRKQLLDSCQCVMNSADYNNILDLQEIITLIKQLDKGNAQALVNVNIEQAKSCSTEFKSNINSTN